MAEKNATIDIVGRRIAVTSLIVSVISFFYGSIDERFYSSISVAPKIARITGYSPPSISVQGLTLMFINAGNRPVAIEHVAYSVFGSEGRPNNECSDKDDPIHKNPKNYFVWTRAVKTIIPDNFQAFVVKPGESEVKIYNISGVLNGSAFQPNDDKVQANFLVGCIFINANSQASGRQKFMILASVNDVHKDITRDELQGVDQQVTLVNARWPFYLILNLFASWRSKDSDS